MSDNGGSTGAPPGKGPGAGASGGTGKLSISAAELATWVSQYLNPFVDDMNGAPEMQRLFNFASGPAQGASSAAGPGGEFYALLAGNPASSVSNAMFLQGNFQKLAAAIQGVVDTCVTNAGTMAQDLLNVNQVLDAANDASALTAGEMMADLGNISFSPGGGGGSAGPGGVIVSGGPSGTGIPSGTTAPPAGGSSHGGPAGGAPGPTTGGATSA